ncbi:hypothetical protein [Paraburkholderia kururiensis]|uniref:hypothetical protein n=1 Tax=Paraburkholderia kururiensis TaxID=984307 RepID=UPI000F877ABA|nr:hypothetical protein [Paraburkholderia kururiensis]
MRAMAMFAIAACLAGVPLTRAQPLPPATGTAAGAPVAATAAPPASVPAPVPDTVLAAAARQAGIRRCQPAVSVVSARTLAGARHADVVLDWDRQDPDGAPFFSLTGLDYGQNAAAVFSLTTVPQPAGCTVLAERISSAPLSCREVARSELPGYQATVLVPAVTVYTLAAHPRETVTLVDSPGACLIVRRQVRYAGAG